MGGHLGTLGGLIASIIVTVSAGIKARNEGWPVLDTMQGKWTGYSFQKAGTDDAWDATRPTATYCLVGGAAVSWVAKKTGYNSDLPKDVNL